MVQLVHSGKRKYKSYKHKQTMVPIYRILMAVLGRWRASGNNLIPASVEDEAPVDPGAGVTPPSPSAYTGPSNTTSSSSCAEDDVPVAPGTGDTTPGSSAHAGPRTSSSSDEDWLPPPSGSNDDSSDRPGGRKRKKTTRKKKRKKKVAKGPVARKRGRPRKKAPPTSTPEGEPRTPRRPRPLTSEFLATCSDDPTDYLDAPSRGD